MPDAPSAGTLQDPNPLTGVGVVNLVGGAEAGATCGMPDCIYEWSISCTGGGPSFNKTGESATVVVDITGERDLDMTVDRDYSCTATSTVTDALGRAGSASLQFLVRRWRPWRVAGGVALRAASHAQGGWGGAYSHCKRPGPAAERRELRRYGVNRCC